MNRRTLLTTGAIAGFALAGRAVEAAAAKPSRLGAGLRGLIPNAVDASGRYALPMLKFRPSDVASLMDAATLTEHHAGFHAAQVTALIDAEQRLAAEQHLSPAGCGSQAETDHAALATNHFLHCVFWDCLGGLGERPTGSLAMAIDRDFGSFEGFLQQFSRVAARIEGSGWAMLGYSLAADRLAVFSLHNHQANTPWGYVPLLTLDCWEHAYYQRFQDRRMEYIAAFPSVIHWGRVGERFTLLAG